MNYSETPKSNSRSLSRRYFNFKTPDSFKPTPMPVARRILQTPDAETPSADDIDLFRWAQKEVAIVKSASRAARKFPAIVPAPNTIRLPGSRERSNGKDFKSTSARAQRAVAVAARDLRDTPKATEPSAGRYRGGRRNKRKWAESPISTPENGSQSPLQPPKTALAGSLTPVRRPCLHVLKPLNFSKHELFDPAPTPPPRKKRNLFDFSSYKITGRRVTESDGIQYQVEWLPEKSPDENQASTDQGFVDFSNDGYLDIALNSGVGPASDSHVRDQEVTEVTELTQTEIG